MSAWATGLPENARRTSVRLRLNGTDLPANWLSPPNGEEPRQINAALPSGLATGPASVTLVFNGQESAPLALELIGSR